MNGGATGDNGDKGGVERAGDGEGDGEGENKNCKGLDGTTAAFSCTDISYTINISCITFPLYIRIPYAQTYFQKSPSTSSQVNRNLFLSH